MNLILRHGIWHLHRRVPRRYGPVEPREIVRQSLHTDSERDARAKAEAVWRELIAGWEAKLAGAASEGEARLRAAKNLAARRGYAFLPVSEVAALPIDQLVERLRAIVTPSGEIDMIEAEAILGGAPQPEARRGRLVSQCCEEYWKVEKHRSVGKSQDQIRRWKNPRIKACRNFIDAVGDMPYLEVTTPDLFRFKAWWVEKLEAGDAGPGSANKDFTYVTSTFRALARAEGQAVAWSTEGLYLPEGKKNVRPPFKTDWIRDKILAPGALDGLNPEARAILLGMVNTGYRPSEGASLTRAQIRLDAATPHISIEPVGRQLKNDNSIRLIPLLGVSLEAFKAFPDGFPRYRDNPSLSDTINKFLRENKLLPTDRHSLYSLRHSFEDRMLTAGIDERIRRDLMGHSLSRERYGDGAELAHAAELLKPISF